MAVKKLAMVALEATAGTVPAAAAFKPMETINLETERLTGDEFTFERDRHSDDTAPTALANPITKCKFDLPFAASGNKNAPPWIDCLQACGFEFAKSIGAGTNYVQKTISIADFRQNNNLAQTIAGCMGNVSLSMKAGEEPRLSFDFQGQYSTPNAAAPNTDPEKYDWAAAGWPYGLVVNEAHTKLWLDSVMPCTESFELDWGVEITSHDIINCSAVHISTIKPTGSITIEAPDTATKNWFLKAEHHKSGVITVPLKILHGTDAAGYLEVASSMVQISSIKEAEVNGDLGFTLELKFVEKPTIDYAASVS